MPALLSLLLVRAVDLLQILSGLVLAGCGGRTELRHLLGDRSLSQSDASASATTDTSTAPDANVERDAIATADGQSHADLDHTDAGCGFPSPPGYLTLPDGFRWLVVSESATDSANAVAFRVSASGIVGPWQLGSHDGIRGEGFSPEGRFFVRRQWGSPAYLTDFGGAEPSEPTLLREVAYEVSWSPRLPILLLQDGISDASVTVMDVRCGGPEIYSLKLKEPPALVNPQPFWAPDGEHVALSGTGNTVSLVDFRSRPAVDADVDTRTTGFKGYYGIWSPDGRWLVAPAVPKPGISQVAGVDTSRPDLPVVPLTDTLNLEISSVTWANSDWLFFSTQDDAGDRRTYAARVDVPPATSMVEFPASARLSPGGTWIAYLGGCGPSAAPGVCLVELKPEGPSEPAYVAAGEPIGIYWSPDGKHLECLFQQGVYDYDVRLIPNVTAGGSPVPVTRDISSHLSWSPDSDWWLWSVASDADERVYAYNVPSASTQLLFAGAVTSNRWSNDGAFLAIITADNKEVIVFAEQGSTLAEVGRQASSTGAFASWIYWQPVPR